MNHEASPETVSLKNATLCVDCELIMTTRSDACPVCGGHSLLNIAAIIGGALVDYMGNPFHGQQPFFFDLHISLEMTSLQGGELKTVIDTIGKIVTPKVGDGRATVHMKIEPVSCEKPKLKAA